MTFRYHIALRGRGWGDSTVLSTDEPVSPQLALDGAFRRFFKGFQQSGGLHAIDTNTWAGNAINHESLEMVAITVRMSEIGREGAR